MAEATHFTITGSVTDGLTFLGDDGKYLSGQSLGVADTSPTETYKVNTFGNYAIIKISNLQQGSDGYWGAYCFPYKLEANDAANQHLYIVNANQTVEEVSVVGAGQPFLLKANAGSVYLKITANANQEYAGTPTTDTFLRGFYLTNQGPAVGEGGAFKFAVKDGAPSFALTTDGGQANDANQVFIPADASINGYYTIEDGVLVLKESKPTITTLEDISNTQFYTIKTLARGGWTANNDGNALVSSYKNAAASTNDTWAILKFDEDYYAYNVNLKKFLVYDKTNQGKLIAGKGTPLDIRVNGTQFEFRFKDINNSRFNDNNNGSVVINDWQYGSGSDDGNLFTITVEGDFTDKLVEATTIFNTEPTKFKYSIVYNGNTTVTDEYFTELFVGQTAVLPSAYNNDLYTYAYNPETIDANTTDVVVTVTWNGPFEFSTNYADAKWYNMYIRNYGNYISYVEDATQYPVIKNTTDAQLATDAFQWAFIDGGFGQVQVINKAAGDGKTLKADGNPLMRDGSTNWDIFKSGEGFVLRETGTANNYINQTGGNNGNFGFWNNSGARNDGGSRLTLTDVPEIPIVTVTYSVKYNGKEVATAEVPVESGSTIPAIPSELNRDYVTFSYDDTQTASEGLTVNVTATWNGPVTLNASRGDVTNWQNLAIRETWYVTSDNKDGDGALKTVNANALGLVEDAYQWAFVGDPYHIQLFNKAETNNFGYSAAAQTNEGIPGFQEETSYWTLKPSTSGIANSFVLNVFGTNLSINQFGGAGGSLKFWNSTANIGDKGSAFTIFDVPTNFAEFITDDVKQFYTSDATGYFTLKPETKALWNDGFNTSCSFEEYEALINGRNVNAENFVLPETGLYRIKNNITTYGMYPNGYMALNAAGTELTTANPANAATDYSTVIKLTKVSDMVYTLSTQGLNINDLTPTTEAGSDFTFTIKTPGIVSMTKGLDGESLHWQEAGNKLVHWNSGADASHWTVEDAESINVPVSAASYATLNVPFAVEVPEEVAAYTGTINGDYLTLNAVEGTIPANTPVVLNANVGTYTFSITENQTAIEGNDLQGTLTAATVANALTLQVIDDQIGFYTFTGTTIPANKAYLVLGSEVKGLSLSFGETDGVTSIATELPEGENIYNLAGQRVSKATKGIYIINGRKVVVK